MQLTKLSCACADNDNNAIIALASIEFNSWKTYFEKAIRNSNTTFFPRNWSEYSNLCVCDQNKKSENKQNTKIKATKLK